MDHLAEQQESGTDGTHVENFRVTNGGTDNEARAKDKGRTDDGGMGDGCTDDGDMYGLMPQVFFLFNVNTYFFTSF